MFLTIVHHYLIWHYTKAFSQFLHVWKNILWFTTHFFSLGALTRSLFSPFKRMTEERKKAWDIGDFFSTLLINMLSRLIGFLVRMSIIIVGLFFLLTISAGGLLTLLVWSIAPAVIVFLIIVGVTLLI